MIREHAQKCLLAPEKNFRWRATEITRLEGFTDACVCFRRDSAGGIAGSSQDVF